MNKSTPKREDYTTGNDFLEALMKQHIANMNAHISNCEKMFQQIRSERIKTVIQNHKKCSSGELYKMLQDKYGKIHQQ